jgi:hypothetical protein
VPFCHFSYTESYSAISIKLERIFVKHPDIGYIGWSIQTAKLDHRMNLQADLKAKFEVVDQPTRLAIAFSAEANDSKALALLLRYEGTHRRTYNRAFQSLLDLQAP